MQTIFSTATNPKNSAICLVRISGGEISKLIPFIPALASVKHAVAKRVVILDECHQMLDDAMATMFFAPKSFTGEDLLEVCLHASPYVVGKFLEILSSIANFRFANPGEFCLRAVKNGKISLNEAEAINKLVLSESLVQHKLAISEMKGATKEFFNEIKSKIIKILSLFETYIDFSEDEAISEDFLSQIQNIHKGLQVCIDRVLSISKQENNHDIQIAILGKPNVGKSTLFNAMIGQDDAIVSSIAGTTRDALRKTLSIAGFKVELIDTAGIRLNAEEIEAIGIEKAKTIAKQADIILLLKENEIDDIAIDEYTGTVVCVFTKSDVFSHRNGNSQNIIAISSSDISPLQNALETLLEEKFTEMQGIGFACNARQKAVLMQSADILQKIDFSKDVELLAEDFRHLLYVVSFLIGGVNTEEILGEIFSSFCIGK